MRIAYLDEAGISNIKHEPYLVIAGIMVHGDGDWQRVHEHLRELGKKYDVSPYFHFHAKDIFHGSGVFDRRGPKWPLEKRRELLLALASIPQKFELPVVTGFIARKAYEVAFKEHVREIQRVIPDAMKNAAADDLAYLEAFAGAARGVDYWLMNHSPNEQAVIILEDSSRTKKDLRLLQAVFRSNDGTHIHFLHTRKFKSKHIIETVHFAEKRDSPLLQLADVCAFVIKRQLMRRPDIKEFYDVIEPQIVRTKRTTADVEMDFEEMMEAVRYRDTDD